MEPRVAHFAKATKFRPRENTTIKKAMIYTRESGFSLSVIRVKVIRIYL
jgi:hypothetical protein